MSEVAGEMLYGSPMDDRYAAAARGPASSVAAGIAFAVLGVLLFSTYSALNKWLAADYSTWQILFFRGLFGFLPFAAWAVATGATDLLRSRQPRMQVVRAMLGLGANAFFIAAYREMPLASAVAIGYAAPIFVVVLSVPLLSERVGVRRTVAALVGFVGVLLIARPEAGLFSAGALYAIAGTLCYALVIIATRRLGTSDTALCTVVYSCGIYALACTPMLAGVWVTPDAMATALLVATGLFGGLGMLLFAHAYRLAQAAVLAPFDYTAMIWTAAFGFVLWNEVPTPTAVVGMGIIAASGLFLMNHERMRGFHPDKP